jgi:transposase-like protein
MTIDLTAAEFHDEGAAREWLEGSRWPNGPCCPHCGSFNALRMEGKVHRDGLFHCRDCRGQFTILTGSVMESSHLPLTKWVLAIRLMTTSKKGISAHQIHRMLNIGYKSAWFMCHRIREAMRETGPVALGGIGKIVEADEAYHGKRETPVKLSRGRIRKPTKRGKGGGAEKRPIVALVERGGGVRATHMNHVTGKNLRKFVVENASRESRLHRDESPLYTAMGVEFATHETVNHGKREYARGDVTTNSVDQAGTEHSRQRHA